MKRHTEVEESRVGKLHQTSKGTPEKLDLPSGRRNTSGRCLLRSHQEKRRNGGKEEKQPRQILRDRKVENGLQMQNAGSGTENADVDVENAEAAVQKTQVMG